MATYAEYPAQTMSSSNDELPLYGYQDWNADASYVPTTFVDQPFLAATTFDSYASQQSFAPLNNYDLVGFQPLEQSKMHLAVRSPQYSPAQSASHSLDYHNPSVLSDSGASVPSTISSAMGSPAIQPAATEWTSFQQQMHPGIVQQADGAFAGTGFEFDAMPVVDSKHCVDPSLIQPFSPSSAQPLGAHFAFSPSAHNTAFTQMPSPAPSKSSIHSPPVANQAWAPNHQTSRRPSISSVQSRHSSHSLSSDDSNKGLCPISTCGRHVKDLKAHMLTHQNERPEKCPILTCEYHTKGFARKYDKNRHTLTHYKGTMVCGFCPGSGSAAEKSFNRADVFKRHLTSVHGVEQTPPNARKRSPAATATKKSITGSREASGMCSTCGNTFANAQDFYEHLDDCVLRVVQQADPSEAINAQLLSSLADDHQVQETMEKHMLSGSLDYNPSYNDDDEADEDDEDEDDAMRATKAFKSAKSRVTSNGAVCKPSQRKGLTLSKGGVPLAGPQANKGGKRKKNYPLSWGTTPDKMKMKKRVLCVYDGQRRLWKDDMMLDAEHEVRVPLPGVNDGRAWVTDLDVLTLRRAEAFHNATDEEKGP